MWHASGPIFTSLFPSEPSSLHFPSDSWRPLDDSDTPLSQLGESQEAIFPANSLATSGARTSSHTRRPRRMTHYS